jgi:hypothetical protein
MDFRKNERLAVFIDGANLGAADQPWIVTSTFRGSPGFSANSAISSHSLLCGFA